MNGIARVAAPGKQELKKMYLEKFKLDRKTALVTGAGQGIGLACAEALAEAGAKVVIADRDAKHADQRLSDAGAHMSPRNAQHKVRCHEFYLYLPTFLRASLTTEST